MAISPPFSQHHIANIIPTLARSLLGLVEERGMSPERICRGLGFTYHDLTDYQLMISYCQMRELIIRCQRILDDSALGLVVGARQSPVSWGLAGLGLFTCETFADAISYGLTNQEHAGATLQHHIEHHESEIIIRVSPTVLDLEIETFLVDEAMASALVVFRSLFSDEFKLSRVELTRSRPTSEESYRHFYRCPIRFDASHNQIVFASHWLSFRLPQFDRSTSRAVQGQLSTLLAKREGRHDLVESVVTRIRSEIDSGTKQRDMAQTVNVSERTLRRKLGKLNTTYRELRDSARYEHACNLLANTELSIAAVAELVGYADARAFRRAFKRWSGMLPGEYRSIESVAT